MKPGLLLFLCTVKICYGFQIHFLKSRHLARMANLPSEIEDSPSSTLQSSVSEFKKFLLPIVSTVAILSAAGNSFAADTPVPAVDEKVELGPPPEDFGIAGDYYTDCAKVVKHMRYATLLEKGNPIIVDVATKVKQEMNDFVSYYRRFNSIAGKQSFSLLYTSISVLAGHYTSYGTKFPVPEKRRKRLLQEYNDIEKNIKKKR